MLVGLVILLPMILGFKGIPFEKQAVSICRLCPAGALEAGVPYSVQSLHGRQRLDDERIEDRDFDWRSSPPRCSFIVRGAGCFVRSAGFWRCSTAFSLFHLRYNPKECVECNLCRSRCSMGVKVDQKVNVSGCIRCLECTTCGAIEPCFALPEKNPPPPNTTA